MKRNFGVILIVVGAIVAGVLATSRASARAKTAEGDAALASLQKDYLERVGWMRANPDPASYRTELPGFFRAYFTKVEEYRKRTGGRPDYDEYLAELGKREGKDDKAAERKTRYELVKGVFDTMRAGKYQPVWTGADKGLRLDVISAEPVMDAGEPKIRYLLALWGAQRQLIEEQKAKRMVTSATIGTVWRLTDAKGKLLGEMTAGEPSRKIDFPEFYIPTFPPQMVLGYYDVDLVPADVAKMEIVFTVSSRAQSGGEARAELKWPVDSVPTEWKLASGAEWKGATTSERPEEEIDPSKARSQQQDD